MIHFASLLNIHGGDIRVVPTHLVLFNSLIESSNISSLVRCDKLYACLFVVCLVLFNATSNNISVISWQSVLLMEETGGPGENYYPVTSH